MSISKDEDLQLRLIREPNSCFANNHFKAGLKAWQLNMNRKPAFNEYTAVRYICQYFPKTQAIKQAAKEAFEKHMHHHGSMKIVNKASLSNQEFSVQEVVYHILPVYFVNTNLPEERVQALLSKKQRSKLPDDIPSIFKKSNIYHYKERSSEIK